MQRKERYRVQKAVFTWLFVRVLYRMAITMEDKRIIELYWRRDQQAIAETRNKYGGFCHHIAMRLLSIREDAEECVSDTLLAAWRRIPPALPESLQAFLGRITRNLAISRYRAATAQKRYSGIDAILTELEDCLPAGNNTEQEADAKALTGALSRWVDSLSPEDRALFVRRYWYGDSLGELAVALEREARELAQRTYKLRKNLKSYLEKEGYTI